MKHHSIIIITRFLKLSIVKTLPKATHHKGRRTPKKSHPQWSTNFPYTFPREICKTPPQNTVVTLHLEAFWQREPHQLVSTPRLDLCNIKILQQVCQIFYFPILHCINKHQEPITLVISNLYIIFHCGITISCNEKQIGISLLLSTLPLPHIMPKLNSSVVSNIASNEPRKAVPTTSNMLPQSHPIWPPHFSHSPKLTSGTTLHIYHPSL